MGGRESAGCRFLAQLSTTVPGQEKSPTQGDPWVGDLFPPRVGFALQSLGDQFDRRDMRVPTWSRSPGQLEASRESSRARPGHGTGSTPSTNASGSGGPASGTPGFASAAGLRRANLHITNAPMAGGRITIDVSGSARPSRAFSIMRNASTACRNVTQIRVWDPKGSGDFAETDCDRFCRQQLASGRVGIGTKKATATLRTCRNVAVVPGSRIHLDGPAACGGSYPAGAAPAEASAACGTNRTNIALNPGVLDSRATFSLWTRALASGKYAAAQPFAVG
ncbi:hypothetical protein ACVWY0_004269 [Arthrobacter sp. UYNi723]